MKTQRDRELEKREAKLAAIDEQVKDGSLKIRQMTKEERAANPPKPRPPKRGDKRKS